MGILENGKIYEYIECKYDEVEERDGGSYPSTQDDEVFSDASVKYRLSIDELKKIHGQYAAHSAKIEMFKTNRLPAIKRKKFIERRFSDILKNNKDLPYNSTEGSPSEMLPKGLDILRNEYEEIVIKLSESGWILPTLFKLNDIELINKLDNESNRIKYFEHFFNENKLRLVQKHVKLSVLKDNHKNLFEDCIQVINDEKYNLAIHSLIPILEGCLSTFYIDPSNTRMMMVCKEKMELSITEGKMIEYLFWLSHYRFIKELYSNSKFSLDEPDALNRHWILHGRTSKDYNRTDCIKIINAIHCLVTLDKLS